MKRGLRRLTAVVSAALLAVTLQIVVAPSAQAGTCNSSGSAEATFLPGTFTASETRLWANWKYGCPQVAALSGGSASGNLYYNFAVDMTSPYSQGIPIIEVTGVSTSYRFAMWGYFGGSNSGVSNYNYRTWAEVRTSSWQSPNFTRNCWIDQKSGGFPTGARLNCSAAD